MVAAAVDDKALSRLIDNEVKTFERRTPACRQLLVRAERTLPLGVPSSFQDYPPYPVYIRRAEGSQIWDVDGNQYIDFNMSFGAMAVGHAHPKLVEALSAQLRDGTMYAMPIEEAVQVGEELCRRFGMDMVRFSNSGTEATMDALRLARGATGRDMIVKIEGSYHGHHDYLMVSVKAAPDEVGPIERPTNIAASLGMPKAATDLTVVVPFNDVPALEACLAEYRGKIAAVIVEPVMMNIGIVHPLPGYLEDVRRITSENDVLLIYDEVKTGVTIAPGGASELYGVKPDIVCLAKSIAGGVPTAAFGGRRDLMEQIRPGEIAHQGTFNGNPLSMRAALVTLTEILTAEAYEQFERQQDELVGGCQRIIEKYDLPMYATGLGAKGCVMFAREELHNYRDYLGIDKDLAYAHWLYLMNRGIFMPPGLDEQWTLSVQHTDADIERHLAVFEEFARAVASG